VNDERRLRGDDPFSIALGIATGPAMVGNVGHHDRLAFTAIGDTVNRAARLEAATRELDVSVLLDEATFLQLPHPLQRRMQRLDSFRAKGLRQRIRPYAPIELARRARPAA
jgi:adenylate cyclase